MKLKTGREDAYQEYVKSNSGDAYSRRVVTYAEDWARLMEERMALGEQLEVIADQTSHLADFDGITGFMYGAAVYGLSCFWEHGERLRRWHNLKTQLGDEGERANESGGVLNPALLNIGS